MCPTCMHVYLSHGLVKITICHYHLALKNHKQDRPESCIKTTMRKVKPSHSSKHIESRSKTTIKITNKRNYLKRLTTGSHHGEPSSMGVISSTEALSFSAVILVGALRFLELSVSTVLVATGVVFLASASRFIKIWTDRNKPKENHNRKTSQTKQRTNDNEDRPMLCKR